MLGAPALFQAPQGLPFIRDFDGERQYFRTLRLTSELEAFQVEYKCLSC